VDKGYKVKPPKGVEKIKRVANATDKPIVIPIILIAVAVHIALVVPMVEGDLVYYVKRRPYHYP